MDPKLKKWLGSLAKTAVRSSVAALIFRLPRWALVLIIVVLGAAIICFGLYS